MASLSVRKLDQEIYEQLRVRAAQHGVSMEEEVCQIIYQAVKAPHKLSSVFSKYFGKKRGVELELPNRNSPHQPVDFNEE